jgi:EpsI family protein
VTWRTGFVVMVLVATLVAREAVGSPPIADGAELLVKFPLAVNGLTGADVPLAPDVIRTAAVDDHLNRFYKDATRGVGLYVGYYRRQRQGEALHSPLFCLPGTGWQPVMSRQVTLDGVHSPVNELIVERGLDRMLVLYWYQTASRVIASEYQRKFYLVADALTTRRTDVALVRVTTRIGHRDAAAETEAIATAHPFAMQVIQHRLCP